jgi:hypothetical protein
MQVNAFTEVIPECDLEES